MYIIIYVLFALYLIHVLFYDLIFRRRLLVIHGIFVL